MVQADIRPGDWICPSCNNHNYADKIACNRCALAKPVSFNGNPPQRKVPVDMRPGDWMCPSCGNHNYADKKACNRCGEPKEAVAAGAGYGAMPRRGNMTRFTAATPYGDGSKLQHQGMAPMVGAVPGAMGASMMGAQLGMPGLIAAVPSPWSAMQSLLPATQASSKAAGGWLCPACSNYNYAIRTNCNRCGIPKGTRISDAGLREGDWICMSCANHNYADKVNCNKCGLAAENNKQLMSPRAPQATSMPGTQEFREGDWVCPSCSNHNYASRLACNKCKIVTKPGAG
ncbi:RanBP2-type zinc finger protein At1g67325 [Durusdinium trenchii]|uniref:RanBP2-type zinc finger protein At1g67325 n=1 Tax=Durusdinium trenchii TaxID=1381693 RepID=A0ABP0QML2_9DINO